jgi:effector-binding domain-containing protein
MPAYQVERSLVINANAERVFQEVIDYSSWTTWSPWLILEPQATVTVTDPPTQVGAKYAWVGDMTGQGEIEHIRLEPHSKVVDEIRFLKPFKSTAGIHFSLMPEHSGTRLTWTMDGKMPWFLFWMIPMIKTFIGMDFQRGLNMLKDRIELGHIPSQSTVHGKQKVGPIRMAGVAGTCAVSETGSAIDKAFAEAKKEFQACRLPTDEMMMTAYTRFQVAKGQFDFISGFQIPDSCEVPSHSSLKVWTLPECNAFRVEHTGSYRHLGNAWAIANQIVRHRKFKQRSCGTFEIYRTVPPVPESELKTDIYLPLKG